MKNIKWTLNSYWSDNIDKRHLIHDVVSINFITTVGAFLVKPVRSQSSHINRENY